MRTLSLYRHAKSSWDDLSIDDFDRPLNERGKKSSVAMGKFIAAEMLEPDLILCSSALRTRETVERTIDAFDSSPEVQFHESLYLASPKNILTLIRSAEPDCSHLMVIAHNPGLHLLAMSLLKTGKRKHVTALAHKYPTAALAIFHFKIPSWSDIEPDRGTLKLFKTPKSLK